MVQASRTTPAEIAEAMENGRALAAQLRQALARRDALGATATLRAAGGLRETIGSLVGDLSSIADRAFIAGGALICLLNEEAKLRDTYRRRPSFEQMRKAVVRRVGDTERAEMAAHEAATAAQAAAAQATRDRLAAADAGRLFGIAA